MTELTGAAKRFFESKFELGSTRVEGGFLVTVNINGELICVTKPTFEEAVNIALDVAESKYKSLDLTDAPVAAPAPKIEGEKVADECISKLVEVQS
jgi:hypothetical protein